jgi:hypothetical protein
VKRREHAKWKVDGALDDLLKEEKDSAKTLYADSEEGGGGGP